MEITNDFMEKLRQVPGRGRRRACRSRIRKDELKIELDRGLANQLGISVGDAAQALRVAFAGVEVGDWVDPTGETRDVAVRLHPDDRVDASNIEHLPIAVAGSNMMVPLDQIATITMGKGPAQIQHLDGKRTIAVSANAQGRASGEVTADAMKIAQAIDFPPGYGLDAGRRLARPAGGLQRDGHRAGHGHRADVPGAGDAVRLVHRAAAGDAVAAAVADRRGAGAAAHRAARSTS